MDMDICESCVRWFIVCGYAVGILSVGYLYRSHTLISPLTYEDIQHTKKGISILKKVIPLFFLLICIIIVIDTVVFDCIHGIHYHLFILVIFYAVLSYWDLSVRMNRTTSSKNMLPEEKITTGKGIEFPAYYRYVWYGNAVLLLLYCGGYVYMRGAPYYGIWAIIAWVGTVLSSYVPLYVIGEFMKLKERQTKVIIIHCIFLSWIMVFFWSSLGFS